MNGAAKPSVHHTYPITTSTQPRRTTAIVLSEPTLKAEGLSLTTWGSSLVLANLLHCLPLGDNALVAGAPIDILELGAGTGLVGLAAAALFGRHATLTDLAPIEPALAANAALNAAMMAAAGGAAGAATLDWNEPARLVTAGGVVDGAVPANKAMLILAADTMYTEDHPRLLSGVIAAWLRRDARARAVVCYPLRVAYLDEIREFWARMEALGLVAVDEGREMVEVEGWDDERENEWSCWGWKEE